MDKITTKEVLAKKIYHNFYCDHCGKFLATRIEASDGYVETARVGTEIMMRMPFDGSKSIGGVLCDDCAKEFKDKMNTTIIKIADEYGIR